jgi:hypothetical protein
MPCTIIPEFRHKSLLNRFICSPMYSQIATLLFSQETKLPAQRPRWLTTESMVQSLPSNIACIQSVGKFPSFTQSKFQQRIYKIRTLASILREINPVHTYTPSFERSFLLPSYYLRLGFTRDFFNRCFRTRNSDTSIIYTMRTSRPAHLFRIIMLA